MIFRMRRWIDKRQERNNDERNNDDKDEYQWRWSSIPMMKRSTNDYDEEEVEVTEGEYVEWRGEEGENNEEEWKVD